MKLARFGWILVAGACISCAHPPPFSFLKGARVSFTDDFSTFDGNKTHNDNFVVEQPVASIAASARAELVDSGTYSLRKQEGGAVVLTLLDPMTHEPRNGPGAIFVVISSGRSTKSGVVVGTTATWTTVCVSKFEGSAG